MARPRKRDQRVAQELKEHRKAEIYQAIYRRRETQAAVARRLGVSQPYVGQLLRELRAEGSAAYQAAVKDIIVDELEFLQHREQLLLEVFEHSRQPRERVREYAIRRQDSDGTSTTKITRVVRTCDEPVLDVAALDAMTRISELRIKLVLPLDEARKKAVAAKRADKQRLEPQLTPQQRAKAFVGALASMAARADAEAAARQEAAARNERE